MKFINLTSCLTNSLVILAIFVALILISSTTSTLATQTQTPKSFSPSSFDQLTSETIPKNMLATDNNNNNNLQTTLDIIQQQQQQANAKIIVRKRARYKRGIKVMARPKWSTKIASKLTPTRVVIGTHAGAWLYRKYVNSTSSKTTTISTNATIIPVANASLIAVLPISANKTLNIQTNNSTTNLNSISTASNNSIYSIQSLAPITDLNITNLAIVNGTELALINGTELIDSSALTNVTSVTKEPEKEEKTFFSRNFFDGSFFG